MPVLARFDQIGRSRVRLPCDGDGLLDRGGDRDRLGRSWAVRDDDMYRSDIGVISAVMDIDGEVSVRAEFVNSPFEGAIIRRIIAEDPDVGRVRIVDHSDPNKGPTAGADVPGDGVRFAGVEHGAIGRSRDGGLRLCAGREDKRCSKSKDQFLHNSIQWFVVFKLPGVIYTTVYL